MLSYSLTKTEITFTAMASLFVMVLFFQFLPLANHNLVFLLAIPCSLIFLLFMTLHVKAVILTLLFSRALLDPWLNSTKIDFYGDSMGLGALINLLVIVLALFLWLKSKNSAQISSNPIFRYWTFYLLLCMASVFYSPVQGKAIRLFFTLSSYLCMMAIPFFIIHNNQEKKFWIKVLLGSTLLPVLFANIDFLRGGREFGNIGMRIIGTFSHPNILGFYLVLAIALSFYVLKSQEYRKSFITSNVLRIYMLNLLILLLATKSRNAWISCWVFFLVYGLLRDRKFLMLCIFSPPFLLINPPIWERVSDLYHHTGSTLETELNSLSWRLELWKRSWTAIQERFFFGYGLGSFKPLSLTFFPSGEEVPAHNVYLEVLFETGIVGILSLLAIYLSMLKFLYRKVKTSLKTLSQEYVIFIAYVICYMFSCMGDNMQDYLVFNWQFWFLTGIIIRAGYQYEKNIHYYSVL